VEDKLKQEVNLLPEKAKSIIITTNQEYEVAGTFLTTIKGRRKKVSETFDPICKKAWDAHKEAVAQRKKLTDPLDEAEKIVKSCISKYITLCERTRREEQRRLEAEEKKRQEEQAILEAQNAETEEEATEIIEEAIENRPVVVAPKIETKVEGISRRMVWMWKYANLSKINPEFLIPDEKKINLIVKSMGKNAEQMVGGISTYQEAIISARS